jgi:hypothetical protein
MTFTLENRFTATKLADWLRPQLTSGALVIPGRIPEIPNRIVGVNIIGGAGLIMEGIFDIVTFHIACRGAENNLPDAEAIALEVDNVILKSEPNFSIGVVNDSVFINDFGRVGAGPTALSIDDNLSRWTSTCNYYASVSTNI